MATAVRVIAIATAHDSNYEDQEVIMERVAISPVHLVSVGPFGRAVARYVKTLRADILETEVVANTIPLPEMWPKSRMHVLAAWRRVPALCEMLDELSSTWQRPFIPLMIDSNVLRLGPIVIPGHAGCWGCWTKRSLQHEQWPKEHLALSQYYASQSETGPQGYLAPFALMAATRIVRSIMDLDSSTAIPGYVWEIDIVKRKITTGRVVGIHNCPRCGLHRPAGKRSFSDLQRELAYLWTTEGLQAQKADQ